MQIQALLAQNGTQLEIVELYQYDIRDCAGCDACVLTDRCPLKDDVPALMEKLASADGVILASPVYLQQVSGKMKTFFDRTCRWYHRPVLAGKPVLCVATTKGSGLKATLSYLKNVAAQWGAVPAGTVGRTIFDLAKPVTPGEIARFSLLLEAPERYAPTLRQLIGFEVQKSLAQYLNGLDSAYWREKQWLDRPYFYPCRVSPLRRAVSGTVGRAMRRGMARGTPPAVSSAGGTGGGAR